MGIFDLKVKIVVHKIFFHDLWGYLITKSKLFIDVSRKTKKQGKNQKIFSLVSLSILFFLHKVRKIFAFM